MGYQTDFSGQVHLSRALTVAEMNYLKKFSETRRMKRDVVKVEKMDDPTRLAVGLPVGDEGGYFVGGGGWAGQERDESILEYNSSPKGQPGLWCKWIPDENGLAIEWSGAEKFYDYVEWMKYIIDHFLKPWGIEANGEIEWQGEEMGDIGVIVVKENRVGKKVIEMKRVEMGIEYLD